MNDITNKNIPPESSAVIEIERQEDSGVLASEERVSDTQKPQKGKLEMLLLWLLTATTLLLPLIFLPSVHFPLPATKSVFLGLSVFFSLILWIIIIFRNGHIEIPKTPLIPVSIGILFAYLASTLFANPIGVSFWGQGFETGTFLATFAFVVLFIVSASVLNTKARMLNIFSALFIAFFVVALYQVIHLLGVFFGSGEPFLSWGLFVGSTANLLGRWYDLGIFFGLGIILSLMALETLTLNRRVSVFLSATLLMSLLLLSVINFTIAWFVVVIFCAIFLIYRITLDTMRTSVEKKGFEGRGKNYIRGLKQHKKVVGILIIGLIFVLNPPLINPQESSRFEDGTLADIVTTVTDTRYLEVRPSWGTTFIILKETLKESAFLGSGPNMFTKQMNQFKPSAVNESLFWGVDFNAGIGFIPTAFITTGLFGAVVWILFLLLFLRAGYRSLFADISDPLARFIVQGSFFGALYLWVMAVVYAPSIVILGITMILTGSFVGGLAIAKLRPIRKIMLVSNPKFGFISITLLLFLLLGSIFFSYHTASSYISLARFQKGVGVLNATGNIGQAETLIRKASTRSDNDLYHRTLVDINILKLNQLLQTQGLSQEEVQEQFRLLVDDAVEQSQLGIGVDPNNYQNWLSLGRIYEAIVPLGIEGAYEEAIQAYTQALATSPRNPSIHLSIARLELARGNREAAREAIAEAKRLKSNYTEAAYLLSQIAAQEGKLDEALSSAESASFLAPGDPVVWFQVGFLQYNKPNYEKAIEALQRAVSLNPEYANARYFLGLSYARTGRGEDALAQFIEIEKTNLDNQEVKTIINNLERGLDPLVHLEDLDTAPEDRESLPLEEVEL